MGIVNDSNRTKYLGNIHVTRITNDHLIYSLEFRQSALDECANGLTGEEYWQSRGFSTEDFHPGYFRKTLFRWREQAKEHAGRLSGQELRGRKPGTSFGTDEQAELAYLREENAYLKERLALKNSLHLDRDVK